MRVCVLILALFATFAAPHGATAQSVVRTLAGQSLVAEVSYGITVRDQSGKTLNPTTRLAIQVYFSTKGNIFSYTQRGNRGGQAAGRRVVVPGQTVQDDATGLKSTWHADATTLTREFDFGTMRQLMRVNVSGASACDVIFAFDKKPGHAKYIIPRIGSREQFEYLEHRMQSKSCRIQPGNIFVAGDV